ncbi:MAG TPA: molybdate ABC transporter substrate-binding protein, partial [Nitrospira sp.]|nr:molybdate ABC transporter substrate-binding protein [Nitrospira sp.]
KKEVHAFVSNELALLVSKSAAGKVARLNDLQKPGLKISMAAEKVPVGAYTREMLKKASVELGERWRTHVTANTVSLESNVSAVFSRVEMDEVDAGLVYRTDAIRAKTSVMREIPKQWNVRAFYYVAVPKDSENALTGQKLVKFVLDKRGQEILAKHGFKPPK